MVFESELAMRPNVIRRLWMNFGVPIFFYIGLAIGYPPFFLNNLFLISALFFFILIIKISSPRSRLIVKFEFDDDQKILHIVYNQFVFYYFTISVSYEHLSFKFRHKIFRRGDMPKTLEFFKSGQFIGEIRANNKIGWTKNKLEAIIEKLNLINNTQMKIHV